ncbi:MAG: DUF1343 domain-containing protein [Bacteroidales bacterium]|nr:DUF1343 domain-containing protein [Bacteroidales bacterium]
MMKIVRLAIICLMLIGAAQAQVRPGAWRLDRYLPLLEGKRVAVCGNQTSLVDTCRYEILSADSSMLRIDCSCESAKSAEMPHLVDVLLANDVRVVKIFCPEHGFRGNAEAGAHIASGVDERTGLPIVSLYGSNKKPQSSQLSDVDVIVFDLQDVGCRFYTYISTLHYVMEAAAENGVEVIVMDRPNPNGYFVDGPVLQPKWRSFVGMHPVPVVYGMTIGEYAFMINGEGWLSEGRQCDLTVVPIVGYTHQTRYTLPVRPSPNLPNDESIYLYPSLCFFEGTNVSIGRGTDYPFQLYGSPTFTQGDYTFTPKPIKGVSENPLCKGQLCRGYFLYSYAHDSLQTSNRLSLEYLINAYKCTSDKSTFFTNAAFFDKLAGTDQLRKQIIQGLTEEQIRASWQSDLESFKVVRSRYLLYE